MKLSRSTIEQWVVVHTIMEEGSFAAAANVLNRSQSSVSYAVTRLQDALGITLFRQEGRRAVLTRTGTLLLAEITPVLAEFTRIERRARALGGGAPSTIRLLVNTLFPKERLFDALVIFKQRFPETDIHLIETIRRTIHDIPEDDYDLAILMGTTPQTAPTLTEETMMAVAHRNHPLARAAAPLTPLSLTQYPHVEIRGLEDPEGGQPVAGRLWRVNTVETAINAVRHGLCYGHLPADAIRREREEGILKPLNLEQGSTRKVPLALYRRTTSPLEHDAIPALWDLLRKTAD